MLCCTTQTARPLSTAGSTRKSQVCQCFQGKKMYWTYKCCGSRSEFGTPVSGIFKDQVLSVLVPDLDPWILISMFATRYPKIHVCLKITYFLGKKNVMLITSTVPILGKTRKTLSQPVSQNRYHPPTFLKFLKHCTLHN